MMYQQAQFGCQRNSNSEDIVEMVIFWLHSDPDLEDSKPFLLKTLAAHDDAPSYQVWFQG